MNFRLVGNTPEQKKRQVKCNTLEIKYKLIINYKLDLVPAQCLSATYEILVLRRLSAH